MLLLALAHCLSALAPPTVRTTNGTVSGIAADGVATFLGIPFAAPPVASLRFQRPQTHPGWPGVLKAVSAGPKCVQGALGTALFSSSSENCLVLNVFAPLEGIAPGARTLAPVLFYIHGGGMVAGSATTSGQGLANLTGHVVFAIQYRLGVLGFFSPRSPPPNLGLEDQKLALRWAAENAEAFGGDRRRVMIFGCSAGGASVAGLLVSPDVSGLYRAAALESPGGHQGWMGDGARSDDDWMSAALNGENSDALAKEVGCEGGRSDLPCLRSLPLDKLYVPSRGRRFAPALV